jgi:hypothetical protein
MFAGVVVAVVVDGVAVAAAAAAPVDREAAPPEGMAISCNIV